MNFKPLLPLALRYQRDLFAPFTLAPTCVIVHRGVRHSVKSRTPSVKSLKSKFEIVKSTHKREIASWY